VYVRNVEMCGGMWGCVGVCGDVWVVCRDVWEYVGMCGWCVGMCGDICSLVPRSIFH